MEITQYQKKKLRGLSHHLKPVVMLGNAGLTEGVMNELINSLEHHELIKVRISAEDRQSRDTAIKSMCDQSGATLIQRVGNIVTLFKRNPQNTRISLKKD
ncbi:MAG: ribosome assembly RNA-binding protein YhbY [Gammaproteobacteria bacterium]|nr:MAG: ribosome assembly RNA-binding protein YhbY [Gammaproteobacteria bacterium]